MCLPLQRIYAATLSISVAQKLLPPYKVLISDQTPSSAGWSTLPHPFENNFPVTSLMKAVKSVKGNSLAGSLANTMTLSMPHIKQLKAHLDISYLSDAQIWALISACFFGLLKQLG